MFRVANLAGQIAQEYDDYRDNLRFISERHESTNIFDQSCAVEVISNRCLKIPWMERALHALGMKFNGKITKKPDGLKP